METKVDQQTLRLLARRVVAHYRKHARRLPFRNTRDPYAIWVSEIMAQQTQLATMVPYWERWMKRFPTPQALAAAPLDDALSMWSGLGYYARARSLHQAAQEVVAEWGGRLPPTAEQLQSLRGIGRYTANAIASIAYNARVPVVDGNVARVFARLFAIEGDIKRSAAQKILWSLAQDMVPKKSPAEFNQGLMDLGATVCKPRAPQCTACPLRSHCIAAKTGRQADFPVVTKRTATPVVEQSVAWITRAGHWLLMRREPTGLFGGLWELPAIEPLRAAGTRMRVERRRLLAEHSQQLSHRKMTYFVYRAKLLPRARPRVLAPYEAAKFFPAEQIANLGVSSATSALVRKLLAHEKRSNKNGHRK